MAKRSITHHKKKISSDPSYRKKKPLEYFPVVRKMEVAFQGGVSPTFAYGDAGAMLSRVNNRLYRYGKKYDIKFDVSAALPAGTTIEVFALSNSWYVQKAFEEAKAVFDQAYENEMENINKTNVARWRDFRAKLTVNASYSLGESWAYPAVRRLSPINTVQVITDGNFADSLVEDSTGTTRHFTWSNAVDATQYGILQQYDLAGNQTRNPNLSTATMPYADLEADSSAVEGAALQADGQDPPYGATAFPDPFVKVGELTVGINGQTRLSTGFFHAPCGVFVIRSSSTIADIGDNLTLEVRAGDYKGVSAPNMVRM
jgi:hypothetical protein